MRFIFHSFIYLSILFSVSVHADEALVKRKNVKMFISSMVKNYGFKKNKLNLLFKQVNIQPKIISNMERPYEKKNWDVYKKLFLTQNRLEEGLKFWKENQQTLQKAEKAYSVPAHVIVAIIGVETLYGKHKGNHRVIDALSTLAFNYPKRSKFFTKELREFLLLCREQHSSPLNYYGSYAGAIGTPQFMPSSYRYYAVDFTGNGKKDLINSNADAIGSVANYFRKHGWKHLDGVAQPAEIKEKKSRRVKTNRRKAEYRLWQLKKWGIIPSTASINTPSKAGLIELDTAMGKEYWLAYPNFYVITRYNTSPQYALAVHLLSQQLKSRWQLAQAKHSQRSYA